MKTLPVDISINPNQTLRIQEDTQVVLYASTEPSEPSTVEVIFEKEGVSGEILGIFKVQPKTSVDLTTISRHMVPNTTCNTKVKTVLESRGKANYVGKIIIEKPAQQTSSFLEHAVLVIGDNTSSNSQPILEIEADDVKASHGSTTGRIDLEQIYYLMSRGLAKEEAQQLVMEGFFESLLGTIIDESAREEVKKYV